MSSPETAIQKLYKGYVLEEKKDAPSKHIQKITVNDLVSKASFFYERIRNALEYSEEHLLRKNAISRILSRRLFFQIKQKEVAEALILELIRARYLPNKSIPETTIPEVAKIIEKYQILLRTIEKTHGTIKRQKMLKKIMGIAASEIEAKLASHRKDELAADHMYEILLKNYPLDLPKNPNDPFFIMLYVAVQKAFLKADKALVSYRMFLKNFPQWQHADKTYIEHIAKNSEMIISTIHGYYDHHRTEDLTRWSKKYSIVFTLLRDLLEKHQKDLTDILDEEDTIKDEIEKVYNERVSGMKKKIKRGVMRSIVYIFFTKMVVALLLEIPYDYYVHNGIVALPLKINILFPPILMFIMGISIRFPKKDNLQKIQESLMNVIYKDAIELKPPVRGQKGVVIHFLLRTLYALTYALSFGAIVYGLEYYGFNLFSGALFILFLCLASFLSFRLRQPIKEISLVERRENIITVLVSFVTTPFLRVGNWISKKFSRINIFLFVLDVLIEAPFQLIVEVLEQWFSYMKEKRDELS